MEDDVGTTVLAANYSMANSGRGSSQLRNRYVTRYPKGEWKAQSCDIACYQEVDIETEEKCRLVLLLRLIVGP